jgi:diguanylate cyclase (GGDEF)-like protein
MGTPSAYENNSGGDGARLDAVNTSQTRAQRRPSMAMRVAIGFIAVALIVLAGHLVTQQSARAARERMRQLVSEHEPIVRSTEALAAAISQYQRSVLDQAEVRPAESTAQHAAESMTQAAESVLTVRNDLEVQFPPHFDADIADFRKRGETLLATSTSRQRLSQTYWTRFDDLDQLISAPQDSAVRFAGAVFASESLMDLSRSLSVIREKVSAAVTVNSPRSAQIIIAGENDFRSRLDARAAELAKVYGENWLAEVRGRFAKLVTARRNLFGAIEDFNEQAASFRASAATVSSLVLTELVEPARRALARADQMAVQAADKADRQLVWASASVFLLLLAIAMLTVTSVTTPVRRLIEATMQVASGTIRTRVPRGGVRELDTLAGAFNAMTEQLERAEQEVRSHQIELETKVDERTRELSHLAHHDPLTQLPNRRQLFAHLEGALIRAKEKRSLVAVMFIDLDNFKTINDGLGHAFGDSVLQAVGERLRLSPRLAQAFGARLGGDEFTLVCEGLHGIQEVEDLAAAVLDEFQKSLLVHGRELRISVSIGASVYPDHAMNSHALLRAADAALFRAKERGRNCASLFEPELVAAAASRFRTEQALRRAVENREFELLYQPQVCFESYSTHAVEALLRWRQPDGTVLSPGDFLDVAEQSGLITEISDWVLRTAIETAATWHSTSWPAAKVAINVSSQQFLSGKFVDRVARLLQQHQLPASCLEIELTENVLQTGGATVAALRKLHELGVSIALDDFGIGYSSLTSLERLPLTRVKIDRSLIASIDTSRRSAAIVRSIIGLCHSLGLQVTAEGVERASQLGSVLNDRGVQVQGYLISRPLSASSIEPFLAESQSHLQQLLLSAPTPQQEVETTGRLRVLRLAGRAARNRSPGDEI